LPHPRCIGMGGNRWEMNCRQEHQKHSSSYRWSWEALGSLQMNLFKHNIYEHTTDLCWTFLAPWLWLDALLCDTHFNQTILDSSNVARGFNVPWMLRSCWMLSRIV
jgi:hypothetical protein